MMKLVHVAMGPPPLRSGGLTAYMWALAREQARGERFSSVALLYPGAPGLIRTTPRVLLPKMREGVALYELKNPVPVGLMRGAPSPALEALAPGVDRALDAFLREFRPDIVHVHSLMGFPATLIEQCQSAGAGVVFTAHDYQPLCPYVTLYKREGELCTDYEAGRGCVACCALAPGCLHCVLRDGAVGRMLKRLPRRGSALVPRPDSGKVPGNIGRAEAFAARRAAMVDALNRADMVLYASQIVRRTYADLGVAAPAVCMPLTLPSIDAARPLPPPGDGVFTFAFVGRTLPEKGINTLLEACRLLEGEWRLRILGGTVPEEMLQGLPEDVVTQVPHYAQHALSRLLDGVHAAVIPSLWWETFGFVALECRQRAVPLLLSDRVGFGELVSGDGSACITPAGDANALAAAIQHLMDDRAGLMRMRIAAMETASGQRGFHAHCLEVERIYRKIVYGEGMA